MTIQKSLLLISAYSLLWLGAWLIFDWMFGLNTSLTILILQSLFFGAVFAYVIGFRFPKDKQIKSNS